MANQALDDICGLITRESISKAAQLAKRLEDLLARFPDALHGSAAHEAIFVAFACTNWNFANGVWSNLENQNLRRDLMGRSKDLLVLALAEALSPAGNNRDKAALAVHIEFDLFQPFVKDYLAKAAILVGEGPDARFALQFALGWIQKQTKVRESAMTEVIKSFLAEADDFNEIEELASQVNRAAEARKSKSLWSRLFGE